MKNVFLLPTDKPSRLFDDGMELYIGELKDRKGHPVTSYNLYITSDEKFVIDEYITDGIEVIKATPKLVDGQGLLNRRDWMKVILSSDLDLDGVQAIDDEFLEWFVKNPSCEYVEVSEDYFKPSNMVYGHDTEPYKIIIPKEEQKQHLIDMIRNDEELGLYEETEQETTLEEAAENYSKGKSSSSVFQEAHKKDFTEGAKWQAQRIERLRNELYEQLPTGEVNAFDLIKTINNHINKLDELIKK